MIQYWSKYSNTNQTGK